MLLVGQMRTLTAPGSGVRQSWAYVAGNAVVVAGWALVGLGSGAPCRPAPPPAPIRCPPACGWFWPPCCSPSAPGPCKVRGHRPPPPRGQSLGRSFGLGIALMAGNLTSLVLYLPALQDLARSGLAAAPLAALVLLVSLVTLAPSLLPPLVLVLTGAWGRARLEQLCHWTVAHQGRINGGLCFVFAAYLGWSGVARL